MTKEELKAALCAAIEKRLEDIRAIGMSIAEEPELGYKEVKTSAKVQEAFHRLGIAYGMTDEIFAVSVSQREPLSPFYSYGLIAVAIPGWVLGTALGAAAGNILPTVLTNALGIAIYGMFIAIILPPAKENRVVAGVVVLSMVLSALFTYLPVLCNISSGFRIIVITLITAGGAALLFPIPDEPAEPEKEMPHEG